MWISVREGFPGGAYGKESACTVGDPGWIPGLGRSPREGKRLPTPVFLPGEFHGQRSLAGCIHGVTKSRTRLSDSHFHSFYQRAADIPGYVSMTPSG